MSHVDLETVEIRQSLPLSKIVFTKIEHTTISLQLQSQIKIYFILNLSTQELKFLIDSCHKQLVKLHHIKV